MTKWEVVFDGSEVPGCVHFGDTVLKVTAHFKTDHDAKLFFGLLNELRDEAQTAQRRVERMKEGMRKTIEDGNR